jgi:hypothetical protein
VKQVSIPRRALRSPTEQREHQTYTEVAREFGGDRVCDACGEWQTLQGQRVRCDCEGGGFQVGWDETRTYVCVSRLDERDQVDYAGIWYPRPGWRIGAIELADSLRGGSESWTRDIVERALREGWLEIGEVPVGARVCPECGHYPGLDPGSCRCSRFDCPCRAELELHGR